MSKVQMHLTMEDTYILESQRQVLSAGLKCSSPQKLLTNWKAKYRGHEKGQSAAHHQKHSPTGEPRRTVVSRVEMQLTTEATYFLKRQRQVP